MSSVTCGCAQICQCSNCKCDCATKGACSCGADCGCSADVCKWDVSKMS